MKNIEAIVSRINAEHWVVAVVTYLNKKCIRFSAKNISIKPTYEALLEMQNVLARCVYKNKIKYYDKTIDNVYYYTIGGFNCL